MTENGGWLGPVPVGSAWGRRMPDAQGSQHAALALHLVGRPPEPIGVARVPERA